jgi:hypothetical protein
VRSDQLLVLPCEELLGRSKRLVGTNSLRQVKDLGTVYSDVNGTTIDFKLSGQYEVEKELIEKKEIYLINEIFCLDKADEQFFGRVFGFCATKLDMSSEIAQEREIYFEKMGKYSLERVKKSTAEKHPVTSLLVSVRWEKKETPTKYSQSMELSSKISEELRTEFKKLKRENLSELLHKIFVEVYKKAKNKFAFKTDEEKRKECELRSNSLIGSRIWVSSRKLIPFESTNRNVYIKVDSFVSMDEEPMVARMILNPHPRGKKRPLMPLANLDLDKGIALQQLKTSECCLKLDELKDNYSLAFEIFKVKIDPKETGEDRVVLEEIGMAFYPLRMEDGSLNVDRIILPIFSPILDWPSVDFFTTRNSWDVYETLMERRENFVRFIVVSVRDEYRKVGSL